MVLCDYRSNEFSMAVIFSLLVFSLQVKTCRIKMTKTTHVHHVDVQITTNRLTVAVSVWKKTHNMTPIKLSESFFSYFIYRFSFPQQPVKRLIVHLRKSHSCRLFYFKRLKRPANHNIWSFRHNDRPNCFLPSQNISGAIRNKIVIKILKALRSTIKRY